LKESVDSTTDDFKTAVDYLDEELEFKLLR
jgi:hypothetical protein